MPRGFTFSLCLRRRAGALLLTAARVSRRSAGTIYQSRPQAGVRDGKELRSALHCILRAPDFLHRPLAFAPDSANYARRACQYPDLKSAAHLRTDYTGCELCALGGLAGSRRIVKDAQDCILGYSQSSLRDWSVVSNPTQDSRPGLLSTVPSGLSSEPLLT